MSSSEVLAARFELELGGKVGTWDQARNSPIAWRARGLGIRKNTEHAELDANVERILRIESALSAKRRSPPAA